MNYEKLASYINRELAMCMKDNKETLDNRRKFYRAVRNLLCCTRGTGDFARPKSDAATIQVMNDLSIRDFEALQEWAKDVKDTANILVKLQAGNYQTIISTDYEKLKQLHRNVKGWTLMAVMKEFAYMCGRDFPVKDSLLALLEVSGSAVRRRLYKTFLAELLPDTSTRDTRELDELRAELANTYTRLNASEESLERSRQEGAELAVIDVLARMNSQEAGMLIDQFAKAEQTLKQLSSAGYQIPPELASVPLCVRMFMQTMRNVFTVSPIHTIGESLTLTLEDAGNYDYTGSDFEDSGEAKTVRVISPGWKCGDEVFSMPKVIEVSNNVG